MPVDVAEQRVDTSADIVRDASKVIKSRLNPNESGVHGLEILRRDSFGNFRARSLGKTETDFRTGKEVDAEIVITSAGRFFLSENPGVLTKISEGNFKPDQIIQTGAASLVIHTPEFPDAVIKFTKRSLAIKTEHGATPEAATRHLHTATGIDMLYWKQALQWAGIRVPEQLVATRDINIEEYIQGDTLLSFLQKAQNSVNPEQITQLFELVNHFTNNVNSLVRANTEDKTPGFELLNSPDLIFDLAPQDETWLESSRKNRRVEDKTFLRNWIIDQVVSSQQLAHFALLPKDKQLMWLIAHAVLVDPFAKVETMSGLEALDRPDLLLTSLPQYNTPDVFPLGTWKNEDVVRSQANLRPAFIRHYKDVARWKRIRKIQDGEFVCIDGTTIDNNGIKTEIPTNLDPKVFRERTSGIGIYKISQGKIEFINENGQRYMGDETSDNISSLKKAGYRMNDTK